MSLDVWLKQDGEQVFEANITHNLGRMAEEGGMYHHLWRPEEGGVVKASQLIPVIKSGLLQMIDDPGRFLVLEPSNGWGSYEDFLPWLIEYYQACINYPDATVHASR